MRLQYSEFIFKLRFESPVFFDVFPFFVLRSILGNELRKLCCLNKTSDCSSCLYGRTCAYSWIFESILEKDNSTVPGRNRGSHPYVLSFAEKEVPDLSKPLRDFSFKITLLGKSTDYLSYIYSALVQGGESGILGNRTKFKVEDVLHKGESLVTNGFFQNKQVKPDFLEIVENFEMKKLVKFKITFVSPLRFNILGKVAKDFTVNQILACMDRRAKTVFDLYGENSFNDTVNFSDLRFSEKKLGWADMNRWSARQKKSMNLGGMTGFFEIEGEMTPYEYSMIKACEILSAGKNTNFGLGQVCVEELEA